MNKYMTQRESVIKYTKQVLGEFEGDVKLLASKENQQAVADLVTDSIMSGETLIKNAKSDRAELRRYVVGLVNDSWRKDIRLNGGIKYECKAPGTRAGSADPVVRELKKMLATTVDAEAAAAVKAEIEARIQASAKPKRPTIDLSILPAEMLERLQNSGIQI